MDFRVSVIMPVYNAAEFIEAAIESALRCKEVGELIIIEDGSSDNSLEICKDIEKKHIRVRVFQHDDQRNHGAGASRNLGLRKAKFPYIAFLDADDIYLPHRFEIDKKIFKENNQADGIYNAIGINYITDIGKVIFSKKFKNDLTTVNREVSPYELFHGLILFKKGIGYFSLDGFTFKKNVLSRMNYWFNNELKLHQDTEFLIRISFHALLFPGEINKAVALRGVHDRNRISEVLVDKRVAYKNQQKLWHSIYQWSLDQNIPEIIKIHLKNMKRSRSIPIYPRIIAFVVFVKCVIQNRNIFLKNRYYKYLHYFFFGKGNLSKYVLKVKNKIQLKIGISPEL